MLLQITNEPILTLPLILSVDLSQRQVSLTMPPPTNAHGVSQEGANVTEEIFLKTMDDQMFKVEKFTLEQVTLLRTKLKAAEKSVDKVGNTVDIDTLAAETDEIAEQFLRLEKYVNINFMGFHKILKKHDKHIPANPIKAFYVARMHGQAWVRGDYSDVVVRLSSIYSTLRNDKPSQESEDASQSFLRSTTKYWIKTEDVSRVKYAILRHLPVFLQKTSTGESDSQMTNR
jgi:SPX domain protein involved in polyphosphate accumulation